ncbi:hypothetical protein B0H34DRAFT_81316 [Crassisporium funariophilum]|nr:hypothetical protein B0H34DRAFT_81316 [Crassisporium funariophilum]
MDTQEAIIANAAYHTRLLNTIAQLEYVSSAKKHQVNYIKDLEGQLKASQERVVQLYEKTKKERKEHETLRDSTSRRLAHKLLGKKDQYEKKESKEEREYVEALEREMIERDSHNVIRQLLEEAQKVLRDLNDKEKQYNNAKTELSALYERVFDGPTESFPEDDRLEYDLHAAETQHDKIQANLNSESRAAELLARAVRHMDTCEHSMQEALGYSRYDMWGGGSMADMMERNALRNADSNATQVAMLVDQAMRASPKVQPVGRVNIAQGSMMSDVFFDNIFTDMSFHNKIKQSAAQVYLANQRLKVERDSARRRVDVAGGQLIQVSNTLDQRRRELNDFRRATFESYAASNPPPPDYDVITSSTVPTGPPAFPVPSASAGPSSPVDGAPPMIASPQPTPESSSATMPPNPQPVMWGNSECPALGNLRILMRRLKLRKPICSRNG